MPWSKRKMRYFLFWSVLCALLICSFVLSSDIQLSQLKFSSDSDLYKSYKKIDAYLLARLKSYFNGDKYAGIKEPFKLKFTANTSEMYLKQISSSLSNIPFEINVQVLLGKYLDTKDVISLASTCKLWFSIVQSATESNLSSFCPYFVLPDPILNIIFYYDIIRYLKVNNLNDEKIHDAFQLYQIQRLVSKDYKPALNVFKPVRDSLRAFLFEIVNGLNSHFPDDIFSHKLEQFKNFLQTHGPKNNCSMTLEYIQNLPLYYSLKPNNFSILCDVWIKRFDDIIRIVSTSKDDLNLEVGNVFEQRQRNLYSYDIDWWVLKSYFECLVLDPEFDSSGYAFNAMDAFRYLIYEKIFSFDLFQKLALAEESFSDDLIEKYPDMEFVLALAQLNGQASGKALYILTRTAIEPFSYQQYCSIPGENYIFHAFCALMKSKDEINLAHSDTLTQMIRHKIFDFTTIGALNRTFLLEKLVESPRFSDILKIFQHENLPPINLLISYSSGGQDLYDGQIDETRNNEGFIEFDEDLILYLRSISDDPLPLLLFPIELLIELKYCIAKANFNINKKYYLDYDGDRIRFLKEYLKIELNLGTVIDFKTIIKMLKDDDEDNEDIMSCFVSDITKFDESTPEDIQPISLKSYFEDVVFETVHIENPKLHTFNDLKYKELLFFDMEFNIFNGDSEAESETEVDDDSKAESETEVDDDSEAEAESEDVVVVVVEDRSF